MEITDPTRRVILDAAIDRSVIRGTLTAPTGERRDFHGWLELSSALEAMLDPDAARRARGRESTPRSEPRGTVPTPRARNGNEGRQER
ncbi:MAG TPA: hypothetical protein VHF51_10680 [Solirubrobacteraceae bacterium]|jgi:hypothetical protein|nr:hypothetical protein [Solirubrobacteraceae bacterium]